MLIKGLLDLIYGLLELLLFINLPAMPETINDILYTFMDYLIMSAGILTSFIGPTGMSVLSLLFTVVISANAFYMTWSIVFWILRKIPMLGIED